MIDLHDKNNQADENVIQVLKMFKVVKVFKVIADQIGGMDFFQDAIYGDDDSNTNHYNKPKLNVDELGCTMKPGGFQRGVLESVPQVILQSVFIILSANDPVLRESENSSIGLIGLSIM